MLQELQLESEIRALEMEVDIQKWPTFNIPKMDQVMNSRFFFRLSVLKRVDHFGCAMRILRTVGTCLRVQNAKHFQVDPSGSAADGDP